MKTATPTASPASCTFANIPLQITLSCPTPTALIYYTMNGDVPVFPFITNCYLYTIPFNIYGTTTIKAVGQRLTCSDEDSDIATFTYTYSPEETVISCKDGTTLAPTTALDIIKRALRLLNVLASGEEPETNMTMDCFKQLNWMVQSLSNDRLLGYTILQESFSLTAGKYDYTIGWDENNDFVTYLPIKIEHAYIRINNTDYPLEIIDSNTYYNKINKITTGLPQYIFLNRSFPTGHIYIYPAPSENCTLYLAQTKQLIPFSTLTDIVCLPPGYKDVLAYGLAMKMAPEFGRTISADLRELYNNSVKLLQQTNSCIGRLDGNTYKANVNNNNIGLF